PRHGRALDAPCARARPRRLGRSLGRDHPRQRPPLRAGGPGRGVDRSADALGDRCRRVPPARGDRVSEATEGLRLGPGVAGTAAALAAARAGMDVTLVTRASDAESTNTFWAQGGIVGRPPGDTPEKLAADIQKAGDYICSPEAVDLLAREGPDLVRTLLAEELAVPFDRANGDFHYTLEGGHSVARILHVKDETGVPIERALLAACRREPKIRWMTSTTAVDLLTLSHDSTDPQDRYRPPTVVGAYLLARDSGEVRPMLAHQTILATGGLGQVYLHTTNPQGSRGDGIAMTRRAGARLLNLEYVQFHPTALMPPQG